MTVEKELVRMYDPNQPFPHEAINWEACGSFGWHYLTDALAPKDHVQAAYFLHGGIELRYEEPQQELF